LALTSKFLNKRILSYLILNKTTIVLQQTLTEASLQATVCSERRFCERFQPLNDPLSVLFYWLIVLE
jgi:hypothetical protein